MSDEAWEQARDEMIDRAENWLDGLGYDSLSVLATLTDAGTELNGDECGQQVIENALADALRLDYVRVDQGYAHLDLPLWGIIATVPLPMHVNEFIHRWNEGTLQ